MGTRKPPLVGLDCWTCETRGSAYLAPEKRALHLTGVVTGHPRKADGDKVITSRVVRTRGRVAVTETGTRYLLGDPHPAFAAWCESIGKPIDPVRPVRVRGEA